MSGLNNTNQGNPHLSIKDPLHKSISDPAEGTPRERRTRWIHNMHNNNSKRGQKGSGNLFRSSESGFRNGSSGQSQSNVESSDALDDESPFDSPFVSSSSNSQYRPRSQRSFRGWVPQEEEIDNEGDGDVLGCSPFDPEARSFEPHHHFSRQKGVRYSLNLRRKVSVSGSISSESEASQEGCENTLNPTSALLLPNGVPVPGGRKHSVLFTSNDWNEESIVHSFREMSPPLADVFEAAWSGNVSQLEELLKDPDTLEKLRSSELKDTEQRSPIHLAAAVGNKEAVQLLIDKGANVNDYDKEKATPLAYAASSSSLPVLELLLANGSNVNAGYDFGKTAVFWAIQAGSVDCAKRLLDAGGLQNPSKIYSETPLHVASQMGDVDCLNVLLEYGADTSLCKGPSKSTALHLAAEEGHATCISALLKAGASPDAKDLRGHTALHIAATTDAESVLALLRGGANPNARDANGRCPIHCSVSRGSRAAECVRMLIDHGAEIDYADNFGYTALHLAAVNESSQCASILLSKGADVTAKTKAGTTALSLLCRKIPDVTRHLIDRLDAAVTIHDHDPVDPDCEVRLDFRAIIPPNSEKKNAQGSKEQTYYHKPRKETEFLTCLLAAGNKKILSHPLSEAFLTLKWQRVRKFFWASLLFQALLVFLFTIFVIEVYLIQCPHKRPHKEHDPARDIGHGHNENNSDNNNMHGMITPVLGVLPDAVQNDTQGGDVNRRFRRADFNWWSVKPRANRKNRTRADSKPTLTTPSPTSGQRSRGFTRIFPDGASTPEPTSEGDTVIIEETDKCEIGLSLTIIWGLLVTFVVLMAIKEIFQLIQSPFSYVVSSENWGQWCLIGSVTMTAYITPGYPLSYWQYPAAAVGIFLAWGLMLLQVGRFPALGLYVQMLGKVAANFGLFILAYACLLLAFALAFCVLFPEYPPYSSVPLAILKVLTMMVGEVDYEDLFYNEDNADDPVFFPITAHILHGAFVIIVTIVLMNLLVGLAVHDIQGLQKGAKLNRLSRQTALISRLESFIFSKRLQSCLPRSIGSFLLKTALLVPSSYNWSYYFRPNDFRDKRLPKDLKMAALRLAATKHSSRTIRGYPDFRLLPNGLRASGSSMKTAALDPQTQVIIRRIEQRLDNLQTQFELFLKAFNKVEVFSTPVNTNASNKEKSTKPQDPSNEG